MSIWLEYRCPEHDESADMQPNTDQLLAKLYALRKDYADDPEDVTFIALDRAFLFISYNIGAFKEYVREQNEKALRE